VKILHKYVLKEHLGPFLFAFSALTSILMLQVLAKSFGNLAGKGLPATIIAEFYALSVPYTLALSFPMAVLVSTLYAFSRLASENEITAIKASGVSLGSILTPALIAAFGVALFMLFFNDQVLPRSNHQLSALMADIAQTKPTLALREQVINEITPGKFYLRANHIEASRLMREVTIYDMSDASRRRTIIADSGSLGMAPNRSDLVMTLYNGVMQDVPTQNPEQLQRLFFKTDLIRVKGVANQFQKTAATESRSAREQSVCQMQSDVDEATKNYESARESFEQNLGMARAFKVKLDSSVYKLDPKPARRRTLGGMYCALLKKLHVPELEAQSVRPPVPPNLVQDSVKRPAGASTASVSHARSDSTQGDSARKDSAHRDSTRRDSVRRAVARHDSIRRDSVRRDSVRRDSVRRALATRQPQRPTPGSFGQLPTPSSKPTPRAPTPPRLLPNQRLQGQRVPGFPNGIPPNLPPDVVKRLRMQNGMTGAAPPPYMTPSIIESARFRMQDAQRTINNVDVEIHKKFALAAACFVFVLIGAPIALRFPRGGVGLTIGASLLVFAIYYIGLIAGASLGSNGIIPPWIAMWATNVIFGIIGILLVIRMGKEGSTARGGGETFDNIKRWVRLRLQSLGVLRERREVV
jgi:lipopolysaccharide export system permease protein